MCELFGLTSKEKVKTAALLKEFFSHALDNPHGWGTAVFDGGKAEVVKEPGSAAVSEEAGKVAEAGFDTDLLLAHIRLATKGQVSMENTHPFVMKDKTGTEWVLVHNGTIFESDVLSEYVHSQTGETDSERMLMYLIDSLDEKAGDGRTDLTLDEKVGTIEKVVRDVTPENKINLLLSDGTYLYAHTNFRGSLHFMTQEDLVTVSSKPLLEAAPGNWEELPLNTVMVFEKGRLVYRGEPHDNEYFEDEEKMRMLFLDYAYM